MDYNEIRKQEGKGSSGKIIAAVAVIAAMLGVGGAGAAFFFLNTKAPETESAQIMQGTTPPEEQAINEEAKEPLTPPTPEPTPQITRMGTAQPIPEDIREYMTGKSWRPNNDISLDQLSYLTIPHYDFNGEVTRGHMVVNAAVAEDVLDIFAQLYDIQYPIERMELVDEYGADDYASIEANNTSAFNYRQSTDGSGRLSKHALGRAIDINPQYNPYVNSSGKGSHSNAAEYWSRDYQNWSSQIARRAYIGPEAEIYKIFIEHGWEWGGSWSSYRDYQHFQKTN